MLFFTDEPLTIIKIKKISLNIDKESNLKLIKK